MAICVALASHTLPANALNANEITFPTTSIVDTGSLVYNSTIATSTGYLVGGDTASTITNSAVSFSPPSILGATWGTGYITGQTTVNAGTLSAQTGSLSISGNYAISNSDTTLSITGGNLTLGNTGSIDLTGSTGNITNVGIIANTGVSIDTEATTSVFNPQHSVGSITTGINSDAGGHSHVFTPSPPIHIQSFVLLTPEQFTSVNSLISSGLNFVLFGSHHRTLLDNGLSQTGTGVWVTGDVARHDPNNSNASIGELGIYRDMTPSLRLGVGTGINQARQGMPVGGSGKLDANYLVLEGAYQPMNSNWSGSTTLYLGSNRATISRGYMVGTAANLSIGHTNGSAWAMRLRSDWHNVATLGQFEASPYFSYTHGESRLNGYTEIGGILPFTFTSQKQTSDELRGGVTLLSKLSEQTDLRFPMELAYRSNSGGIISGEVLATPFSVNTPRTNQSWGRTGVELDHRIDKQTVLNGGLLFASRGGDSSWLCTFSLKHAF
jgi:hypothetical protein